MILGDFGNLDESYAVEIARDWNTKDPVSDYIGYVTRFQVNTGYLAQFKKQQVGGKTHQEYWIPSENLDQFNANIIGKIEIIHCFKGNAPKNTLSTG